MRKPRPGEYVCRCKAYEFPHRFDGGKCSGLFLAQEHWDTYWGHDLTCRNCACLDEETHTCQVLDGGDSIRHCEVYQDFIHTNNIKIAM